MAKLPRDDKSRYIYMDWRPYDTSDVSVSRYSDFNLLTMVVSAVDAKKFGHQTVFYTDPATQQFLDCTGLTGIWDRVDADSLNQEINRDDYDVRTFINAGKFFALQRENLPCALIDTDLIPWIDTDTAEQEGSAVFTHYEQAFPENQWYPAKEKLPVPEGYCWNPSWDFTLSAANTSFLALAGQAVKDAYCREAFRYMYHNQVPEELARACVCFVEQKILTMLLKERGLLGQAKTLVPEVWNPRIGKFRLSDDPKSGWCYDVPDPRQKITHSWISKAAIAGNRKYRDYYCISLIHDLMDTAPDAVRILQKQDSFVRYFRLIDRYGTVKAMADAGIIRTTLDDKNRRNRKGADV